MLGLCFTFLSLAFSLYINSYVLQTKVYQHLIYLKKKYLSRMIKRAQKKPTFLENKMQHRVLIHFSHFESQYNSHCSIHVIL